jgi:hypothetical protein
MEAEERFNKRSAPIIKVEASISGAVCQDVREVEVMLRDNTGRGLQITMTPDDARYLAHSLINTADSTDRLAGDEPTS